MNKYKKIFIVLFILLYVCTSFVSTYHAVSLFELANDIGLAIILAIVFEIGQATVLFSILTSPQKDKHILQWILMIVLTTVQVIGNVFSSYRHMIVNNTDQLKYFTEPILWWVADPNPQMQNIILSYMIGAILPIIALCLTGTVASYINEPQEEVKKEDPEVILNKKEPENKSFRDWLSHE